MTESKRRRVDEISKALDDFERLKNTLAASEIEAELVYQVWSDLLRVRKWKAAIPVRNETLNRIMLQGRHDRASNPPGGVQTCWVVPLRADEQVPLAKAKEHKQDVILALVDGDSTTAYYKVSPVSEWESFL
ncbi:hypothetical protein NDN08_000870 [Rhodosorus marinus]|uniref:tRNA-splicing endonuclease subunit Sen15 domain-containing protein n=1 Tax=Rhodosorus marinus TaxID=101924 RepID=A0AAV8UPG5_9RHOD|nr:hypothetical protein NDN08_000870 [Rhodosorus marinus]